MKHFKLVPALLLSLSSVAASDQPHAGRSWKDAGVTNVTAYTTGGAAGKSYVVVTLSSNGTGTPSCASGYPRNFAYAGCGAMGPLGGDNNFVIFTESTREPMKLGCGDHGFAAADSQALMAALDEAFSDPHSASAAQSVR
jgi:hypothetical protein